MSIKIPEEIKYITPYVQRGQEVAARDPVVSYYAQYYAAKLAIARGPRTKETTDYLSHLLDALETQKQAIGANEAITDDLVGYAHVENFALKIFINADNEDRAGKSSKKTAKTFLAASIFLELLKTFGELDSETEAKIKYSKWKAADIMKALREGRVPTPGPPGGIEQEDEDVEMKQEQQSDEQEQPHTMPPPPSISEFPSPPSNFTAPLPQTPHPSKADTTNDASPVTPVSSNNKPPTVVVQQPSVAAPVVVASQASTPLGPKDISAAQKYAKWAISALEYEDIDNARVQLLAALKEIGFNQENNFGF
ncbi:vacuolar protein sorting-associated protein VTA1 homolog isoform X1 [Mucor ambiguus]|uniref:Vacuolar protein sorting-associated protein VTA1 homolog isoform X1 n=1 Tax=Mucor ambiguus TaxID=91626 RepID=A0A0C9LWF7_9FUNG|nr:vacuolar protein sorting-associated protein VTA1 homolog isoform X1 [Mucor ambiguus]